MALTLSVSNGKLIPSADFYSPSNGVVELTLSAGAFVNQYSPVDHDVTVYQWQYDSENVELDYGTVTLTSNSGSFELKFGCEFFVIGLKVGKHETIQTTPIHIGGGASGTTAPLFVAFGQAEVGEGVKYYPLVVPGDDGGPATGGLLWEAISAGRLIYLYQPESMAYLLMHECRPETDASDNTYVWSISFAATSVVAESEVVAPLVFRNGGMDAEPVLTVPFEEGN